MNAYSCKPSDHPSDAGMHTLMCMAVLAFAATSLALFKHEYATISRQLSGIGLHVIITGCSSESTSLHPISEGAWSPGVGQWSFRPYHRLIMDSLQVKTERITCWGHCFWFPCLGEQQVPCCIDRVGSVHIVSSADKCF